MPNDAGALPVRRSTALQRICPLGDWRDPTRIDMDLAYLVRGDNEIAVTVSNARGPALLSVRIVGLTEAGEPLTHGRLLADVSRRRGEWCGHRRR